MTCILPNGCCPTCSKKANTVGILGIVGLAAGIALIVAGSVKVAQAKHLHAAHDHKGGFIGMIVVGVLAFLFGLTMILVAAAADLTVGIVGSWSKPDFCPKECKCC